MPLAAAAEAPTASQHNHLYPESSNNYKALHPAAAADDTQYANSAAAAGGDLLLDQHLWSMLFSSSSSSRDDDNGSIAWSPDTVSPWTYVELIEQRRDIMRNLSDAHHIDDPEFDYLRRSGWRGLILALYITVICIGIAGNSLVVFVVCRNKHMQNVTNIFIANLALSDIGLCIFSLPVQLYYQMTDHWIFGDVLCRVVFTAFAVPMYCSTLTIFFIAFDRYWLIVHPLNRRLSIGSALGLIAAGFLVSMLLATPVICFTAQHHLHDPLLLIDRKYCVERWPSAWARVTYSLAMFFFQFCLPLAMTAMLYYKIYCRLRRRPPTRMTTTAQNDRTGRTNKILFAIVVLFVVCWLPWNLFSLVSEIDKTTVKGAHFKLIDLFLKLFAMSSSCINPFLYCWLNDNFRKELDSVAIKLHLLRSSSSSLRRRSNRAPRVHYHHPPATMTDAGAMVRGGGVMIHADGGGGKSRLLKPGGGNMVFVEGSSRLSISHCPSTLHTTIMPDDVTMIKRSEL